MLKNKINSKTNIKKNIWIRDAWKIFNVKKIIESDMSEKYLDKKCSVTVTMCKFYLCTKWTTPLTTVKSFYSKPAIKNQE